MDPLPAYLLAFVRHWASLVTGLLVGGVLFIAEANGVKVSTAWYQATGVIAVFFAGYLTWRDQHQLASSLQQQIDTLADIPARIEAPAASLSMTTSEGVVYIDVTNTSELQATYTVEVITAPLVAGYTRFEAAWKEGEQGPRLIPAGQTRSIRLAILYARSGLFQWALLTPRKREPNTHRVAELLTEVSHVRAGSRWAVTVEVISTPQMENGIARKELAFDGADVIEAENGKRLHLLPDAKDKVITWS